MEGGRPEKKRNGVKKRDGSNGLRSDVKLGRKTKQAAGLEALGRVTVVFLAGRKGARK